MRSRRNTSNGTTLVAPNLTTAAPARQKKRSTLSSLNDAGSEEHILGEGENMQIYKTMSFKVEKG
jgi:hypothetical protein